MRATKAEARTAVDVTAVAAADKKAVGSTAADSVGSAETTNEAAGAAENSACDARHGRSGAHVSCCGGEGGRTRGMLAWADIDRKRRGRKPAKSRRLVVLVMLVA